MHPLQSLTLTLAPALEAPSPWRGHHSPPYPSLLCLLPPPHLALFAMQIELSEDSSWGDLPLLLDFCWGANARGMWGNSSEGPPFANCPPPDWGALSLTTWSVIISHSLHPKSKCKQWEAEPRFPRVIIRMGRAREVMPLVSVSFKGK